MRFQRAGVPFGIACALWLALAAPASRAADAWDERGLDTPRLELVMRLVVTCTSPERIAPEPASKDGRRDEIWPIVGGRFVGKGIRGVVVAGGGDFPVTRPDGVTVIDALYRLKTDDGVTIIIHNRGLEYPGTTPADTRYRLAPEFIAPQGKYDWLNRHVFVSSLVYPVPESMRLARGEVENDRLIEVYQVR